jgi:hypothetical protein
VTALKDVSGQLGPIGATIQTKLASTTDEGLRGVLGQQKTLAVELYDKLQVGFWWGHSVWLRKGWSFTPFVIKLTCADCSINRVWFCCFTYALMQTALQELIRLMAVLGPEAYQLL